MRPISLLSSEKLEEYGQREVRTLCDHCDIAKTSKWKENGVQKEKTTPPLINSGKALEEWNLLKKVAVAEKYPRDCMWELWHLINKFHSSEFPNLVTLAQLALTSAAHTASCERGFSVQNNILTPLRNCLTIDVQHKLISIKLGLGRAYLILMMPWKNGAEGRTGGSMSSDLRIRF